MGEMYMEIKKKFLKADILVIAFSIAIINIGLVSFIQDKLNEGIFEKILADIIIIVIVGFIGKHFASKVGFPLWWYRNMSVSFKKQFFVLIMLGLVIIIPNTLIYYFNQNYVSTVSWLNFSNFKEIVLLSLRAGLYEEILFRLFVFTLVTCLVTKVIKSKQKSIIMGIIISSFIFGLIHGGVNIQASIFGGTLAYIYYKNGLVPAIIIHFLADAIPWTLLYILD